METLFSIVPILGIGVGLFWAVYKHASNTDRHPAKKDLVFKDVCEPKMERIEDCMEGKLEGLEKLMNQRFDGLERLVRNGGNDPGRVRT